MSGSPFLNIGTITPSRHVGRKNLSKITLHNLVKCGLKASHIYLKYSLIKLFFPGDFLHFKQSITSTTYFTMYKHQVNQIQHSYHTHNIDTFIVLSDNQIFKVFKQIFYSKITITVVSTTLKNNSSGELRPRTPLDYLDIA